MRFSTSFPAALAPTRLVGLGAVLMAALAPVAAWASLRGASLILVAVSAVSFMPVGFYLLLLGGTHGLIGACNLLCLAAGLVMAVWFRGAEGRGAPRQGV